MIQRELDELLALRNIDLILDELTRREHGLRVKLAEGQGRLVAARQAVQNEKHSLDEILKQHRLLDLDLKQREEQIKKHTSQMYEVKTNKEYTALKEEIERDSGEMQGIEDKVLALMMKEDEMKGAIGRRNAELSDLEKSTKELEAEVKAGTEQVTAERAEQKTKRQEAAGVLSASLLRRYEQIRKLRGGSPLASITPGSGEGMGVCSECHMTIRPQLIVDLYKKEELVPCESCGRILYLDVENSSINTGA